MCTSAPLLADALELLAEDLRVHLDEAESLATQNDEWTEQDSDAARKVIIDLTLIVRGLLLEHQRQDNGECRICTLLWPCPVATTIHGFLKDPHRQFVALAHQSCP